MAAKRKTTLEDTERLAENLRNRFGDKINSRETFSKFYDMYMEGEKSADQLKPKVFTKYVKFAALEKVKKFKKKEVVVTTEVIDKKVVKTKEEFTVIGMVKRKIVFARLTSFKIRGAPVTRFIDRKGRFVKVTSKEQAKDIKRRGKELSKSLGKFKKAEKQKKRLKK